MGVPLLADALGHEAAPAGLGRLVKSFLDVDFDNEERSSPVASHACNFADCQQHLH